ncbi:hypothetical protein A5695_06535 [Mycobacterium sp. E1747]|nr:hypothetical protein A5695_06535 [Mycobacterium sp. E1747]
MVGLAATTNLLGIGVASAVPYPLPPGYLASYDQGYATMTRDSGSKYVLKPSTELYSVCYDELRTAQAKDSPANEQGFVAGCVDAARHSMGIYYPCDRNGDDPVCPRRP